MSELTKSNKLSLFTAIIININIMLGAGIFINTSILVKQAGSLSAAIYGIVGILLLPLIVAIAQLMSYQQHESTFYHFGKIISPYFGFLSTWAYFIAKLSSCGLAIHVSMSFLQEIIPFFAKCNVLFLDSIIIGLFVLLNLINLKAGLAIHFTFIVLKLIPVLFAILSGLYLFSGTHFSPQNLLYAGIPGSIPLVLYAFTGFEASCSLSQSIQNPEKNGPRAVLISYIIVISLVMLYQLLFFSSLGATLGNLAHGYLEAYPTLLNVLIRNGSHLKHTLATVMHIGIASSSLGSGYGIMYSNTWNLFTLACANHTIGKKMISATNKYGVPIMCIVIQALIILSFLCITKGYQVPLQQVGALGATIAYTFSTLALLVLVYRLKKQISTIGLLSLFSCSLLLASFAWSIATKGISMLLLIYLFLLFLGSCMFFYKHTKHSDLEVFEHL